MGRVAGVILAGGTSSRMGGGDKCLRPLAGLPLLAHIIKRFSAQVDALALNANGDSARFAPFGLPVLPDPLPNLGPLGGVLAGLHWAHAQECRYLVTVACDTPFFPQDLVARLCEGAKAGTIAQASSQGRLHPTFALWPVCLLEDLEAYLRQEGASSMRAYAGALHPPTVIDFSDTSACDPFFNINTEDELEIAERIAGTANK